MLVRVVKRRNNISISVAAKCCVFQILFFGLVCGQTAPQNLRFEVASLKPALSVVQLRDKGIPPKEPIKNPKRFEMYTSMRGLISAAYRLEGYQTPMTPEWTAWEFYSLAAKLPDGANLDQAPDMLQTLLAERCKLAVHWETKGIAAYTLSVAKGGPRLKKAEGNPGFPTLDRIRTSLGVSRTEHGWVGQFRVKGQFSIEGKSITITDLLLHSGIRAEVDMLPIFDKTGLTGLYDLSLPIAAMGMRRVEASRAPDNAAELSDPAGADVFRSFEKLGLKLEKATVPVPVLVVDHVEKVPSEN